MVTLDRLEPALAIAQANTQLTPTEQRLSEFAAEAAPKIAALAKDMRAALENLTSDVSDNEPAG